MCTSLSSDPAHLYISREGSVQHSGSKHFLAVTAAPDGRIMLSPFMYRKPMFPLHTRRLSEGGRGSIKRWGPKLYHDGSLGTLFIASWFLTDRREQRSSLWKPTIPFDYPMINLSVRARRR
jgi:hypothetical protein